MRLPGDLAVPALIATHHFRKNFLGSTLVEPSTFFFFFLKRLLQSWRILQRRHQTGEGREWEGEFGEIADEQNSKQG